jgi:hypothetical protein
MTTLVVWECQNGKIISTYINPDYTDLSQIEAAKIKVQGIIESERGPIIRHDYDPDMLPEPSNDQRFFNVWEWVDDAVVVNMPKARGIQMDKIREVRNKELVKKDIEFIKALEVDDGSHTAIAAEKQVLRDIPQTFDLTTETPEQLKELWPEGLSKE